MKAAAFGSNHLSAVARVGAGPHSLEAPRRAVESIAEGEADHTARNARDQENERVAPACR